MDLFDIFPVLILAHPIGGASWGEEIGIDVGATIAVGLLLLQPPYLFFPS